MLNKKQKKSFKRLAVLSLLLGVITIVPFRTLTFLGDVHTIELTVKFIALPVILLLLSIKPNLMKYKEIKDNRLRSRSVNLMSYFPICAYLVYLLLFVFHTLTLGGEVATEPLGVSIWSSTVLLLVVVAALIILFVKNLNKIIMALNKCRTHIFDACFAAMILVVLVVGYAVVEVYYGTFSDQAFYLKGDLALLVLYVIGFISFFTVAGNVKHDIQEDEVSVKANVSELTKGNYTESTRNTEYQRAYQKVLNDFEAYYQENKVSFEELPEEQKVRKEIAPNQTVENKEEVVEQPVQEEAK